MKYLTDYNKRLHDFASRDDIDEFYIHRLPEDFPGNCPSLSTRRDMAKVVWKAWQNQFKPLADHYDW